VKLAANPMYLNPIDLPLCRIENPQRRLCRAHS
jgi:hypothetical protein